MLGAGGDRALTHARLVLAVGAIGVAVNAVAWIVEGHPQPYHAAPLLLVLWVAADLLKTPRPAAARAVRAAAGVLLVAVGLAVGVPAATALVRGEAVDWLDLVLGVLVVLYAAVAVIVLAVRKGGRKGGRKGPRYVSGARIGENGPHERS
ncbi:hypothetical protein AMK26_02430 [Streptomyces sp. CB03234]|uniref:hypothetical protein n=1 Tax=Streptomyces sp. (strain CB03234) TaxID=1703937 RepID=UPI00093D5E53|nr:hypothetical protein [Streptomyces sp. CB03234]OKK07932.1 hypothetical protein AMK26_02430 [Streptomyces sp. CB03234]